MSYLFSSILFIYSIILFPFLRIFLGFTVILLMLVCSPFSFPLLLSFHYPFIIFWILVIASVIDFVIVLQLLLYFPLCSPIIWHHCLISLGSTLWVCGVASLPFNCSLLYHTFPCTLGKSSPSQFNYFHKCRLAVVLWKCFVNHYIQYLNFICSICYICGKVSSVTLLVSVFGFRRITRIPLQ